MQVYKDAPAGAVGRARSLRRNATDAEKCLWRELRERFPKARFRRQVPVGPYIADFLSFGAKLIIEADGGQHSEAAAYDARRTAFLESQGYFVLRFWNNDILSNTEGVGATIAESLSHREREGGAKRRKGEGDRARPTIPSPSKPLAGALASSDGRGDVSRRALAPIFFLPLAACAAHQSAAAVAQGAPGFWLGMWHGFIFPVAAIVSIFVPDVSVYAVPNNGGWYNVGYFVGIVFLGVGANRTRTVYVDRRGRG